MVSILNRASRGVPLRAVQTAPCLRHKAHLVPGQVCLRLPTLRLTCTFFDELRGRPSLAFPDLQTCKLHGPGSQTRLWSDGLKGAHNDGHWAPPLWPPAPAWKRSVSPRIPMPGWPFVDWPTCAFLHMGAWKEKRYGFWCTACYDSSHGPGKLVTW